jgi:lipoprotein-releasing system permease protein
MPARQARIAREVCLNAPMFRPFSLFVGLRYVRARRRTRFISVVSAVALAGLALGVAALVVVLSVMNGFDRELRTRILALVPHVLVSGSEPLGDWEPLRSRLAVVDGVRAAAPWIGGTAMLSTPGVVRGVELGGVRPREDMAAIGVASYMREGSLEALQPGRFGIVIGNLLARSLGAGLGDSVTVMLPEVLLTPAGVYPRMRRFEVVGIFAVGAQVDSTSALIHLEDAARLYRTGDGVHALRLALQEPARAPELGAQVAGLVPPGLTVSDWSRSQGTLFGAIRMEKRMVSLLLLVIVAVAAFNIVSILTMVVAEKRAAIAVLRTMGASPGQVMAVFSAQGTLIGLAGVATGLAAGIPLALNVSAIAAGAEQLLGVRLFNPNVYFISYLPSEVRAGDVLAIAACAVALCLLATIYPARRAARIGPAEALRYE